MLEEDILKSENDLKLNSKVTELIKNFSLLVNCFNDTYEFEPGLYLYKKLITKIRKKEIEILLEDDKFIGLLYTTLWSWGMNIRGAKMKSFKSFYEEIKKNQKIFVGLSSYQVIDLTSEELTKIFEVLKSHPIRMYLLKDLKIDDIPFGVMALLNNKEFIIKSHIWSKNTMAQPQLI